MGALAAAALLALPLLPGPAHAAVVSGTLGNVPMGGTSSWQSSGRVHGPDGDKNWVKSGDVSTLMAFEGPSSDPGSTVVTIDHQLGTSLTGGVELSSAASARGYFSFGATHAFARGSSTAVLNDYLFIKGTSLSNLSISFEWRTDGTLQNEVRSTVPGSTIGSPNGVSWATLSTAELLIAYTNPQTGQEFTDVIQQFRSSVVPARITPDDAHWWAIEQWGHSSNGAFEVTSGRNLAPGASRWVDETTIDQPGTFSARIPLLPGIPVPVSLRLFTAYNATWLLEDIGAIETAVVADFAHTATLQSVRLFNADGSPYLGSWELVSANGIDYPELILPAQASVSAPASLGLLMIGLAGLALRTPRRLTPPA